MSKETTPEEKIVLRDDFVRELISPDIACRPFGNEDSLSDYLYRPMNKSGPVETMIAFIDKAAQMMDQESLNDEYNHIKIHRMLALLVDIPETIQEEQRLEAWAYCLGQDWVHKLGHHHVLDKALAAMARKDEGFAEKVRQIMKDIFEQKRDELSSIVGKEKIEILFRERIDFYEVLDLYSDMRNTSTKQAVDLYNSIVTLMMTVRHLSTTV